MVSGKGAPARLVFAVVIAAANVRAVRRSATAIDFDCAHGVVAAAFAGISVVAAGGVVVFVVVAVVAAGGIALAAAAAVLAVVVVLAVADARDFSLPQPKPPTSPVVE